VKDDAFFRRGMAAALTSARDAVQSGGIGLVVYAEGTTGGWEAILDAIIDSQWIVTSSWPIDTEMENRTHRIGATRNVTACALSNSRYASAVVGTAFDGGRSEHAGPPAPTRSPDKRKTRAEVASFPGARSEHGHWSHMRVPTHKMILRFWKYGSAKEEAQRLAVEAVHLEFNHAYAAFPTFTFEMNESGRESISIRELL